MVQEKRFVLSIENISWMRGSDFLSTGTALEGGQGRPDSGLARKSLDTDFSSTVEI